MADGHQRACGENKAESQILHPVPSPTSLENLGLRFWPSFSACCTMYAPCPCLLPCCQRHFPRPGSDHSPRSHPHPLVQIPPRLPLPKVRQPNVHGPLNTTYLPFLPSLSAQLCFRPNPTLSHPPSLSLEILPFWQAQARGVLCDALPDPLTLPTPNSTPLGVSPSLL